MLIHVDSEGRVVWMNTYLSEEKAQSCLSEDTFWVDVLPPEAPECTREEKAVLYYRDGAFSYEKEAVEVSYNDTQQIMQAITDLEVLILEGSTINV